MKALLVDLLRLYVEKEEKPYSTYLSNMLAIIGLVFLGIANYFYFYEPNKEIGSFLAAGSIFLISAVLVRAITSWLYYIARKRTIAKFTSGGEMINVIEKQLASFISTKTIFKLLPFIIRYLPMGTILIIISFLLKHKLSSKIDNIIKASSN